ncbi:V-snare-domain-containing protein [Piedraia hortae CBS 480.64]|uniref:V-snare-domain-containing protein n=1 Tax=Piedraia hortae CBS 480.64 TaxID=1314780 RepID=A0A6A7C588_9PEZI|nr:V-snare-domain-containing protein [Piedraia hortae CBS 480.64]
METDGSERFGNYEAELQLIQADLSQRLDSISELSGEARKSAVREAERALEEAKDVLESMRLEKGNMPQASKVKVNQRFRGYEGDIDVAKRKLAGLKDDKAALFGRRYKDDPDGDVQLEQRQQLLSGTDRLERSSSRLREAQRIANDTEAIGSETLNDLARQREGIERTRDTLLQSEGYTDRSNKTLRGMARRMATNKIVTVAIITVLVLLILAVIVNKFR